jgi:hypothetical protein
MFVTMLAAIAAIASPSAAAAATPVGQSVSSNWAGYVAKGRQASTRFSEVSGSWVQPSITPGFGNSYSVFWVGLGGSGGKSNALEQVGTEGDVIDGKVEYHAWYELVPAGPVKLPLAIRAGDKVFADVRVSGTSVTVGIADWTTDRWSKQTLRMARPDTGSAEWIAEAPSSCQGPGGCGPLSLADFTSVTFGDARATAAGHTGAIDDPAWTSDAVTLNEPATGSPAFVSLQRSAGGAQPSRLFAGGGSFWVSWTGGFQPAATFGGPAQTDSYTPLAPSFSF